MANRNLGYDVDVDYTGAQAAYQALGDLLKFNTELENVDHAAQEVGETTGGMFEKATSSWTEFKSAMDVVSGAFNKVQQTAQKAWETMERGAELDRISGQAEALAADIGTSWKSLLADMTDSTGGMITQADLTASAVDIIGLGMADTGSEVVRLSRLVGELGWDMQTLTLTLANQSKARLDSLGLSVGDVTTRIEKLKDAGVEADQAFKLAVLEAGEAKLKLLGSAADTAAGDLKKLEATWGDLMDEIAKGASEASAPLAQVILAELQIAAGIEKGIITQKQFSQAQSEAIFTSKTMAETLGALAAEIGEVEATESKTVQYYRTINEQRLEAIEVIKAEEQAMLELRSGVQRVGERETEDWRIAPMMKQQRQIGRDIVAGYIAAGEAVTVVAEQQQLVTDAAEAWAAQIAEIQATSGDVFTVAAFDADTKFFDEAAFVTIGGRTKEQTELMGDLQKKYDSAAQTIRDYQTGVKGFGEDQDKINAKVEKAAEAMAYYGEKIEPLAGIIGEVQQVTEAGWNVEALNESLYELGDSIGFGAVKLAGLGVELGLITEEQAAYGISIAQLETVNASFSESIDAQSTSWLQLKLARDEALRQVEKGVGEPIDKWDASTFYDSGKDNQIGVDASPIIEAISEAVEEGRGIIDGFTDPDEEYEVEVGMDISAVEMETENANRFLDSIEDKTVTVTFAAVGYDDIQDKIDELQ